MDKKRRLPIQGKERICGTCNIVGYNGKEPTALFNPSKTTICKKCQVEANRIYRQKRREVSINNSSNSKSINESNINESNLSYNSEYIDDDCDESFDLEEIKEELRRELTTQIKNELRQELLSELRK